MRRWKLSWICGRAFWKLPVIPARRATNPPWDRLGYSPVLHKSDRRAERFHRGWAAVLVWLLSLCPGMRTWFAAWFSSRLPVLLSCWSEASTDKLSCACFVRHSANNKCDETMIRATSWWLGAGAGEKPECWLTVIKAPPHPTLGSDTKQRCLLAGAGDVWETKSLTSRDAKRRLKYLERTTPG